MKVFLDPIGLHSTAMQRVSKALQHFAPPEVRIVRTPKDADLQLLHVIGADAIEYEAKEVTARDFAVIQYCYKSAGGTPDLWQSFWDNAKVVWSYYDLSLLMLDTKKLYYAPLGVDGRVFCPNGSLRNRLVMTSGYVSAPIAEAIEEVADAALKLDGEVFHLGPANVEGMKRRREVTWTSNFNISDYDLASEYSKCKWVSGLRHVEGFELPVLEGLACGARPIVFDRPEMRAWYGDHAVFIPECCGPQLVEALVTIFQNGEIPVDERERRQVISKFNWAKIAQGFWERVL